jgi:hypothetical protein
MLSLGVIEPAAVFREGYEPFSSTVHPLTSNRLASAVAIVELVLKTDKNIISPPRAEIT